MMNKEDKIVESYILALEDIDDQRLVNRIVELDRQEQETDAANAERLEKHWWFRYDRR